MRIVEIELTHEVRWRIRCDDPASVALQTLPGWVCINPLSLPLLSRDVQAGGGRYRLESIVDDSIVIETNVLLLGGPDGDVPPQTMVSLLQVAVPQLLAHLRYQSKQTSMARAHVGGADVGPDRVSVPAPMFPVAKPGESQWMQTYDFNTAITWGHLARASQKMASGAPPLFADVLLDAVLAFLDRDDRRTILYATMAIEIIAKAKLHAANQPTPRVPRGHQSIEWLLHHQPQAVLGRSLQHDQPRLYQLAQRVYRTRNQIVHEGLSLGAANVLPAGGEGAFYALECASGIFSWYGEPGEYVPAPGFVVAQIPVGHVLDFSHFPYLLPRTYRSALS